MKNIISLKKVNLSFCEKSIFNDLSLDIFEGENICFSGPSGVGKSSLLKIIQGSLLPNSGEIVIDSKTLSNSSVSDIRKNITWIPQNINLVVDSAEELIKLLDAEKYKPRTILYLNELDLDESYLTKSFSEISGGQKQRIIIAICLSFDKEIIILDEPTASLDEASIEFLISCINKRKNKTIISSSHNSTWIKNATREIKL